MSPFSIGVPELSVLAVGVAEPVIHAEKPPALNAANDDLSGLCNRILHIVDNHFSGVDSIFNAVDDDL